MKSIFSKLVIGLVVLALIAFNLKIQAQQMIANAVATPAKIDGTQYTYHSHRELPDAIANKRYTRQIVITHTNADTFVLLAGQTLPTGLSLDATTGFVSGVPTVAGAYKFGVQIGGLTYMVHLMVMPASGETLTPAYYDEKGSYAVNQESIVINFATNELIDGKETSINALISYPANAGNLNQLASGKFPVISLMHGSGYQGIHYTQMLKILSSHGFIVIAPTTLTWGHSYSIWRNWQIIQRRGYESILNMDLDSASKYFGHANRDAIGLIGHSWGGATTELNIFNSPARAFVLIDDISLYENVSDWNKFFNCFSQPDPFPAKPIMILKGGPSNYNSSLVEFEGAFTGPRYLATFNSAQHENFLNFDFGGWADANILVEDYQLSRFTNRNTAHHLASFFKRYLLDDVGAGANLYSSFALTQANDISPFGGSMVAVRPDWAGQLMIDDFSNGTLLTNNLGLAVTSTLTTSNGKPMMFENINKVNSSYNFPANDLVARAQFRHLHIDQVGGSASGVFTETLGTTAIPLDASFYSHIAFEISQKKLTLSSTLPLSVQLLDANGAFAEIPISNSVPAGGFQSILPHSILLPLNSFSGVNISKLISMKFVMATPSQNLSIEIDNIRFERIPAIINVPPTAKDQTVSTNTNNAKTIFLVASDKNDNPLTYSISTQPTHGTVSLAGSTVTYTPSLNYEGYDQFIFQASDGSLMSNSGVINITVAGTTARPVANNLTISSNDLNPISIVLTGSDAGGQPLTYTLLSVPAHGALQGTVPNLIYDTYGQGNHPMTDSFTFKVNSGKLDSNIATVTINFIPVNHVPYAYNVNETTVKNRPRIIKLNAGDYDNEPITYQFTTPLHGSLSGLAPNIIYTPVANYSGKDSFTYTVNDGKVSSTPATVSITVNNLNSSPTISNYTFNAVSGYQLTIDSSCGDADRDPLTFSVVSNGNYGTTSMPFSTVFTNFYGVTYVPNANFVGTDTIKVKANDGFVDSAVATITINVALPQVSPIPLSQTLNATGGVPLAITVYATDPNADPIYYELTTQPIHGVLTGIPPNLTYTANANYTGPDGFIFSASDGCIKSNATININSVAAPDTTAPTVPNGLSVSAISQTTLTLSWSASTDAVGVTGYKIFKGGVQMGTSATTNANITGLTASTSYSFTISAYDAAGNNSAVSNALNVTTLAITDTTAPTIPNGLVASSITQTSLILSWSASSDAVGVTGYKIFRGGSQIGISATTNISVSGLTAATSYSFSVSAYDAAGNNSGVSSALSVTTLAVPDSTAPTVPNGLVASSITQTSLSLSWSASSDAVGVTGYKIFKGGSQIGTSATTNFAVTGLTAATSYSFTVSAYDAAGNNSGVSSALSVTTLVVPDTTAPTVPNGLVASSITQTSLSLSWSASNDAVGVTGYKIFKGGVQLGTSATTNISVTGLTASTLYSFTVSAYDAAGNNSAVSSSLSVTTLSSPDTIAPTAPYINSASGISHNAMTVSWVASTDAVGVTGYKIFSSGNQIGTSVSTNFSMTGLTPNTTYSITVSAFDAAGNNSILSNVFSTTTTSAPDTTAPTVPNNLMASAITQTSLTLTWSASTDAFGVSGYKIFKGGVYIASSSSTNYTVTGLTASTLYSFTVSAYDAAINNSAVSSAITVTTAAAVDATPPTVPAGLTSSAITQTTLTLSWLASTDIVGVTGYKIFKNGSQIGTSVTTNFSVTGLTASTLYLFTVSAYDAAGNNSAVSSTLSVLTSTPIDIIAPTVPTINSASGITQNAITISWTASTDNIGVLGYKVFKNSVLIGTTVALNYSFSGLSSYTNYSFTVSAFDATGNNSALSAVYNIKTVPQKFKMEVTYGPNGSISPEGFFSVYQGSKKTFTVTPNIGYQIESVIINGVNAGAISSFTLSNINSDYKISATFKAIASALVTSTSIVSSISPAGEVVMIYGKKQTFTMAPTAGFQVEKTLVDGVDFLDFNKSSFGSVELILVPNSFNKLGRLEKENLSILN
jgi:chitodextrinase